jgi:hypothetical protein
MIRKSQKLLEKTQAALLDRYGHIMPPKYKAKFEHQLKQTEVNT